MFGARTAILIYICSCWCGDHAAVHQAFGGAGSCLAPQPEETQDQGPQLPSDFSARLPCGTREGARGHSCLARAPQQACDSTAGKRQAVHRTAGAAAPARHATVEVHQLQCHEQGSGAVLSVLRETLEPGAHSVVCWLLEPSSGSLGLGCRGRAGPPTEVTAQAVSARAWTGPWPGWKGQRCPEGRRQGGGKGQRAAAQAAQGRAATGVAAAQAAYDAICATTARTYSYRPAHGGPQDVAGPSGWTGRSGPAAGGRQGVDGQGQRKLGAAGGEGVAQDGADQICGLFGPQSNRSRPSHLRAILGSVHDIAGWLASGTAADEAAYAPGVRHGAGGVDGEAQGGLRADQASHQDWWPLLRRRGGASGQLRRGGHGSRGQRRCRAGGQTASPTGGNADPASSDLGCVAAGTGCSPGQCGAQGWLPHTEAEALGLERDQSRGQAGASQRRHSQRRSWWWTNAAFWLSSLACRPDSGELFAPPVWRRALHTVFAEPDFCDDLHAGLAACVWRFELDTGDSHDTPVDKRLSEDGDSPCDCDPVPGAGECKVGEWCDVSTFRCSLPHMALRRMSLTKWVCRCTPPFANLRADT